MSEELIRSLDSAVKIFSEEIRIPVSAWPHMPSDTSWLPRGFSMQAARLVRDARIYGIISAVFDDLGVLESAAYDGLHTQNTSTRFSYVNLNIQRTSFEMANPDYERQDCWQFPFLRTPQLRTGFVPEIIRDIRDFIKYGTAGHYSLARKGLKMLN